MRHVFYVSAWLRPQVRAGKRRLGKDPLAADPRKADLSSQTARVMSGKKCTHTGRLRRLNTILALWVCMAAAGIVFVETGKQQTSVLPPLSSAALEKLKQQ